MVLDRERNLTPPLRIVVFQIQDVPAGRSHEVANNAFLALSEWLNDNTELMNHVVVVVDDWQWTGVDSFVLRFKYVCSFLPGQTSESWTDGFAVRTFIARSLQLLESHLLHLQLMSFAHLPRRKFGGKVN